MSEPTDAQLGQTVRKFADYLADELGWLSNGDFDLDRLNLAAHRLEAADRNFATIDRLRVYGAEKERENERLRALNAEMREALFLSVERLEAIDGNCLHSDVATFARAILSKTESG